MKTTPPARLPEQRTVVQLSSMTMYRSKKNRFKFISPFLFPFVLFACVKAQKSTVLSSDNGSKLPSACSEPWNRDFVAHAAVEMLVDVQDKAYFLGDVHGEIEKVAELLRLSGLDQGSVGMPHWSGGRSLLISVGDLVNKGSDSLGAVTYFMTLQEQAARAGGRVIVLAGNHEMSFLIDPKNQKSEKFMEQISTSQDGTKFCESVYSSRSKIGRWLRDLPAAVKINSVFVAHSGFPKWTLSEIDSKFREFVGSNGTQTKFACGDVHGDKRSQGFFNAEGWWRKSGTFLEGATRLGVFQILFGHDPGAFGSRGRIEGYFGDSRGRALIKLDVGLVTGDSEGELLRCDSWSQSGACSDFVKMQRIPSKSSERNKKGFLNQITESPLVIEQTAPPPSHEGEPEIEC